MTSSAPTPSKRLSRRTVMLAVALLAVIAAVVIATLGGGKGGGGGHDRRARIARQAGRAGGAQSDIQLAASYLGLSPEVLRRRLRRGETLNEVAESTPGRSPRELMRTVLAYRSAELRKAGLTRAQAQAQEQQLREKLTSELRRSRRLGAALAPASKYLGISEAQLRAQLRSGRTIAQVAAAHGHSRAQLLDGILRVHEKRLHAQRRAGTITAADESKALALLRRRAERLIDIRLSRP
ncbi:MAG TPA: hypothetical protein VNV44_08595 [Solirubrobacteraceae bacterium]|nr:hypothetical protein [Solirubrobacteraceae bacterium]